MIEVEDLHDIVLLGHSYGGMVATAVANRLPVACIGEETFGAHDDGARHGQAWRPDQPHEMKRLPGARLQQVDRQRGR
ncbi:alpha/beta hydrolase [Mesorhizobium sp. AR10]|uniref:alpha/beta hydrolase n=1 Tax=Mesorhizobium sp. AR10 TaxID=2865839 RepID=UPI0029E7FA4E|nr:alpha/beta hydrolase [Mesorhizobium sp. AR10]